MGFYNEDYRYKQEEEKKKNEIEKTINYVLNKLDETMRLYTIMFECDYLNEIDDFILNIWKNLREIRDEKNNRLNTEMSFDFFEKRIKDYLKKKYNFFETDKCIVEKKNLKFWGIKFEGLSEADIKSYLLLRENDNENTKRLYEITPDNIKKRILREKEILKTEENNLKEEQSKTMLKNNNQGRINHIENMISCSKKSIINLEKELIRANAVKEVYPIYEEYLAPKIKNFMLIKTKVKEYYKQGNLSNENIKEILELIKNSFIGENIGIEKFM